MVFLGLVHMHMTIPNLIFLFMRPPLIPFGFCSSYQLLIKVSAHGRGGSQARRQGAEGESKRSKEGGKAKGGGEGNKRKALISVAGREYDERGGRHVFAGHQPAGRVEVFVFTKGRFH
jgi:hypothetical protein